MTSEDITLSARDGYPLAATVYHPTADTHDASQWIVIGSATAVPRGFYKRFCEYAASRGVHAIAVDYRGIGGSKSGLKNGSLRGFKMDYADWSAQDLAAAVDYATSRGPAYLVGHSLGGHAIGQLPDPNALQAAYICGGGAGWHGWMPRSEQIKVWTLWHLIGPVATTLLGYQPMSKFGIGEDIPLGVYRDWKRWCSFPRYFFDDPAPDAQAIAKLFDRVTIPVAAATSTDDLWAPPASRDAFFSGYRSTKVACIDLKPHSVGAQQIGHMGYFRKEIGATLWPELFHWLSQHGLKLRS